MKMMKKTEGKEEALVIWVGQDIIRHGKKARKRMLSVKEEKRLSECEWRG